MFTLLRSYGPENALARTQSEPLFAGLNSICPNKAQQAIIKNQSFQIEPPSYIIIHYDDKAATKFALQIKKKTKCKIICLGSDIYKLDTYINLSEFVDIFFMPTLAHKEILAPAIWATVEVLPEGIDSIALPNSLNVSTSLTNDTQICWFGYPESFKKSLGLIFDRAILESKISRDNICFITNTKYTLSEGIKHLPFSWNTFHALTAHCSYSLLSHFVYDEHINTHIKSPNKMITSLIRGMTPIVSYTRNYKELINRYNLHHLSFNNGPELSTRLAETQLNDNTIPNMAEIQSDLLARHSPLTIANTFLSLI